MGENPMKVINQSAGNPSENISIKPRLINNMDLFLLFKKNNFIC